jgi:formate hydrogenlyase subunit 3/multisubunit Na+/H+ antiporter MnhD subunit
MLVPAALFLLAAAVALGSVPIALIFLAELLVQRAGLSQVLALLIATAVGFLAAAAMALAAWGYARNAVQVFQRSRDELARNIAWLKQALNRPAAGGAEPPQTRGGGAW